MTVASDSDTTATHTKLISVINNMLMQQKLQQFKLLILPLQLQFCQRQSLLYFSSRVERQQQQLQLQRQRQRQQA